MKSQIQRILFRWLKSFVSILFFPAYWDKVKRVRAGVKANYGDDSQQFEMVGGTRTSERKAPTRRLVTA